MVLTKLKNKTQNFVGGLALKLYKFKIKPNHLTISGLLLSCFSAICYYNWKLSVILSILAPTLLLLSGFLDLLDGVLARVSGELSPLGGFLDSMADRYADSIILTGIILGGLCNQFSGLLALIGSVMVSYSRARAEVEGVKMETVGFAERPERILILAFSSFASIIWPNFINLAIMFLALITHLTVIQRVFHVFEKLSGV